MDRRCVSTLMRVARGLVRVMAVVAAGVLATACTSSSSEPEAQPTPSASTPTDTPTSTPTPTESVMPEPGEQARLDARLVAAAWENDVELARRLIERGPTSTRRMTRSRARS